MPIYKEQQSSPGQTAIQTVIILHKHAYEAERLIRMFFLPTRFVLLSSSEEANGIQDAYILSAAGYARIVDGDLRIEASEEMPDTLTDEEAERRICVCLFRVLIQYTGYAPDWGILTGVRPVKWIEKKQNDGYTADMLCEQYWIQAKKLHLANQIIQTQKQVAVQKLRANTCFLPSNGFCLYIGIPFCPSRCSYCSFVSESVTRTKHLVPAYLNCLLQEIQLIAEQVKQRGLYLYSIYIGGGTPTVLSAEQLDGLLLALRGFDKTRCAEFTVEAGRPDTITREKLAVLKQHGVDRLSINPQTMSDRVLRHIARQHTAKQTEEAFFLSREIGFSHINMDIIAGLPSDTEAGFTDTLGKLLLLSPESVTVHSLSIKRAAALYQDTEGQQNACGVGRMTALAYQRLTEQGYTPYYLYRQRNTIENHENIGYAKPGFESIYNIVMMEETGNVLAAGCGGTSKWVTAQTAQISRSVNFKYPHEYINRFAEVLERKNAFLSRD